MNANAALVVALFVGALAPAFACGRTEDIHELEETKQSACITCHSAAFKAAANPVHVNSMPETCQDCHGTKAWSPALVQDHSWFPLQNKHQDVKCASCHSTGYGKGQTSKECQACHRKDYDGALDPKHAGFPLDCTKCHDDSAFKPSSFKHPWPLAGKHVLVACNACHTGAQPKFAGTPTDCFACHEAGYQASPFPSHATFPKTCLDCHRMSGWKPAISGLHPEGKFPLTTGVHSDPGIKCQDCHRLEKGASAGGQNTDCIGCHLGSHVSPAIDAKHAQLGVSSYPPSPTGTNFCLSCHPTGKK